MKNSLKQIQVNDSTHKLLKSMADTTGIPMPRLVEVALTELMSVPPEQIAILADPVKIQMARQIRELQEKLAAYEKGAKR